MDRFQLFRNLVMMAAADGAFSESEIQFLTDRALQWGIDDSEFSEALQRAVANREAPIIRLPDSTAETRTLVEELIRMMAADGALHESEKRLFATAVGQLGMNSEELNALIDEIVGS